MQFNNEVNQVIQKLLNYGFNLNGILGAIPNLTGNFFQHGHEYWYKDGQFHREDGPAVIDAQGTQIWYKDGQIHREDGPAVIHRNGKKCWVLNDIPVEPQSETPTTEEVVIQNWIDKGLNFEKFLQGNPFVTGYFICKNTHYWCKEGKFHREDGPAVIKSNGTKMWYLNGELHREDGPAAIYSNGTQEWYKNDKRHRTDGPAVIAFNGTQQWYQDDKLHREDGPAAIYSDDTQEWYKDGKLHREGGPAVINTNGRNEWYQNGKLHRLDGPAIIKPDGTQIWYKDGNKIDPPTSSLPTPNNDPAVTFPESITTEEAMIQKWLNNGTPIKFILKANPLLTGHFVVANGIEHWYKDGKLHRTDGPAIVTPDGKKYWFKNGISYYPENAGFITPP